MTVNIYQAMKNTQFKDIKVILTGVKLESWLNFSAQTIQRLF